MTARKRERLAVIHDLLETVRDNGNSILPTPLMRYANLSTTRFSGYVAELLEKGFLREVTDQDGKRRYTLTDTGFAYLQKYRAIREFIDEFDL